MGPLATALSDSVAHGYGSRSGWSILESPGSHGIPKHRYSSESLLENVAVNASTLKRHNRTSFLFGFGSGSKAPEMKDDDVAKMKAINDHAVEELNEIKKWSSNSRNARKKLDETINARLAAMKPLCQEYMRHMAELKGLAGAQCQAAQGRVNSADIDDSNAPWGCLSQEVSGGESEGTPVVLQPTRCSMGLRRLLCTERLDELLQGRPAPGEQFLPHHKHAQLEPGAAEHIHKHTRPEKREGEAVTTNGDGPNSESGDLGLPEEPEEQPEELSMDEEVRQWCHPAFRLDIKPISEDLSRGVMAPTAADVEVAQD